VWAAVGSGAVLARCFGASWWCSRLVHFAVLGNHVHFVAEAEGSVSRADPALAFAGEERGGVRVAESRAPFRSAFAKRRDVGVVSEQMAAPVTWLLRQAPS